MSAKIGFRGVGIYLVAAWFGMALVGYGIAVRSHVKAGREKGVTDISQIQTRDGKISEISDDFVKLESANERFNLPTDVLREKAVLVDMRKRLQPGARVLLKNRISDMMIVEIVLNPSTAFQRSFLSLADTARQDELTLKGLSQRGVICIIVGLCLTPITLGARVLLRRKFYG